jgi:molecular chaperone GrpE
MSTEDKNLKDDSEQIDKIIEQVNESAQEDLVNEEMSEIAKLKAELNEMRDKYLRIYAEFDNFKKRTSKERIDLIKNAAQDTLTALLPILDDFDRAKKNAEVPNSTEPFSEGINLLYHKFTSLLKSRGLEVMETNGKAFDPEFHEAISEIPVTTPELHGKIVDTVENGYFLHDKLIRHAKVVVGK